MKFLERNILLQRMIMINSVLLLLAVSADNNFEANFQMSIAILYIVSVSIVALLMGFRQLSKYIKFIGSVLLSEMLSSFYIIICNHKYGDFNPDISLILLFNFIFQTTICNEGWSYSLLLIKHLILMYINTSAGGFFCYFLYQLLPFMLLANFFKSMLNKSSLANMYKLKAEGIRQNLHQISTSISEGLLILSTNNQILFASSNLLDMLKCDSTEILEIITQLLYITSKADSRPSTAPQHLYEDIKHCIEVHISYKNLGRTRHESKVLEWIYKKIEWNSQESVLLMANDVTDLYEMECKYKDSHFKSSLLKIVSHELRTPCNSIIFFSDKCIENTENSSPLYEYLTIVKNSSTYMLLLINDILDYTKIISGNFRINKQEFCPREIFTECVKLFEYQAKKKNLTMHLMIDQTMPDVAYSDSIRLKQILLNLLSNSVK
jgi:nitrogen-specific signal transduction histidine kinase